MLHPILVALLESLELKELPAPETELLQKILNDNLITIRAQQLMVEHFAPEVIRQLHPQERAPFLKRIAPPKPVHLVLWTVQTSMHSRLIHIHGQCGRCGQDVNFTGKPDEAPLVKWGHCTLGPSAIPPQVIAEYKSVYVPTPPGAGRF